MNSKHLFFIITSLAVVTLKTFPTAFIKLGGRDTWIAMILASPIILLYIWLLLKIHKKSGNYNLLDIYSKTLGKWVGAFFSCLFLLTILLTIFESAGAEAIVIHSGFQLLTPVWVFIAVTALSAVYIVKKGIASVTITTIIVIFFISISGIILGFLTHKYKEMKHIYPILEHGMTVGFFLSTMKILGALSCVIIFVPYLDSVRDKTKLIKHSTLALLFIIQMLIFSMLGVITTFGPERAEDLLFPKLIQTQIISAFGFLEAGELFVMLQVVAGWYIRYVVCLFALMELIRQSGMKIRFKEYYICALTIIFSYLFSKNLFDMFHILDYLLYVQLINFFVIPLIIYILYYFKEARASESLNSNKKKRLPAP
ncbi:GerAB/ArcD/ProY family transporter [Paenibacillus durus]|uniref:GerAB/ArcD/ProY family transporter n=1 Tax=Paenibacillus durus TaxID=44251 RepID=UPI0005A8C56A|nr:endospore germination permease [Paenibacillus durus]